VVHRRLRTKKPLITSQIIKPTECQSMEIQATDTYDTQFFLHLSNILKFYISPSCLPDVYQSYYCYTHFLLPHLSNSRQLYPLQYRLTSIMHFTACLSAVTTVLMMSLPTVSLTPSLYPYLLSPSSFHLVSTSHSYLAPASQTPATNSM
jgi:hypothetical protein